MDAFNDQWLFGILVLGHWFLYQYIFCEDTFTKYIENVLEKVLNL